MAGITYVMNHPEFRSVKVGYTSPGSARYEDLMRNGWQPYRNLHVESTELARRIEQATLFEVRFRLHVPVHLTSAHMPHINGWTETSSIDLISPRQAWEIVCEQGALEQLAPVVKKIRVYKPPVKRGVRSTGDTPRFVRAARVEAARTARAAQVATPSQPEPKSSRLNGI